MVVRTSVAGSASLYRFEVSGCAAQLRVHLSAPTIVLEATQGLTLKVGANFITLNQASISVMGTVLNLNSGGAPLDDQGVKPVKPEEPADVQPTAPTPADGG